MPRARVRDPRPSSPRVFSVPLGLREVGQRPWPHVLPGLRGCRRTAHAVLPAGTSYPGPVASKHTRRRRGGGGALPSRRGAQRGLPSVPRQLLCSSFGRAPLWASSVLVLPGCATRERAHFVPNVPRSAGSGPYLLRSGGVVRRRAGLLGVRATPPFRRPVGLLSWRVGPGRSGAATGCTPHQRPPRGARHQATPSHVSRGSDGPVGPAPSFADADPPLAGRSSWGSCQWFQRTAMSDGTAAGGARKIGRAHV